MPTYIVLLTVYNYHYSEISHVSKPSISSSSTYLHMSIIHITNEFVSYVKSISRIPLQVRVTDNEVDRRDYQGHQHHWKSNPEIGIIL